MILTLLLTIKFIFLNSSINCLRQKAETYTKNCFHSPLSFLNQSSDVYLSVFLIHFGKNTQIVFFVLQIPTNVASTMAGVNIIVAILLDPIYAVAEMVTLYTKIATTAPRPNVNSKLPIHMASSLVQIIPTNIPATFIVIGILKLPLVTGCNWHSMIFN